MPRPTALDIANAALAEIAGGQIDQGIELGDPQDDLSALVGSIYAREKRAMLSEYPWSFARKREALTPVEGTTPDPASGFTHAFQLPADMLASQPRGVYPTEFSDAPIRTGWRVMGVQLHGAFEQGWIEYQYEAPEAHWPPLFVRAFHVRAVPPHRVPLERQRGLAPDLP